MLKLIKKTIRSINNLEAKNKFYVVAHSLENKALYSDEPLITGESILNEGELVVSLTTYGKRIHDIHLTLESLARQTQKANRVVLWLDEEEFTIETIPLIVKRFIKRGLEVRFCPNYRSYKKIVPSLKVFPKDAIVTVDDDIIYPFYMIETLVSEHAKSPHCIVGHRGHRILKNANGQLLPYSDWKLSVNDTDASHDIFITTGGGTLFPAGSLPEETINEELFQRLCPHADDIWLKIMALKNDVLCKLVDSSRSFDEAFIFIPFNQDSGLSISNVHLNRNDVQLAKGLAHFNLSF